MADYIANFLIFYEPPEIAHIDNSKEFKGTYLLLLKRFSMRIINGRPHQPQT